VYDISLVIVLKVVEVTDEKVSISTQFLLNLGVTELHQILLISKLTLVLPERLVRILIDLYLFKDVPLVCTNVSEEACILSLGVQIVNQK
jgi:hypothetical protein